MARKIRAREVLLSNRPLQSMRYCEWEPLVANVRYWHREPSIFRRGAACRHLRLAMSESRRRRFSAWRMESGPRTSRGSTGPGCRGAPSQRPSACRATAWPRCSPRPSGRASGGRTPARSRTARSTTAFPRKGARGHRLPRSRPGAHPQGARPRRGDAQAPARRVPGRALREGRGVDGLRPLPRVFRQVVLSRMCIDF